MAVTRAAARRMVERRSGTIVMINSMAAERLRTGRAAYAGSKSALATMAKVVALELAPHNIRVNSLHPGYMGGAPVEAVFRKWAEERGTDPETERQKILATEAYSAYNELTQSRQARLNTVTEEMPGPLWVLVVVGALVCIAVTWCFHTASFSMHFWMTVLFSALLGLMIYLVAALDNPYRGKISVSPEPLERVYQQAMAGE
jgi:hypothetical protein